VSPHTPKSALAFLAALLLAPLAALYAAEQKPANRPNVIVILADDLAYADLSCYGSTFHESPNLDRLAAQGMRFTQAYSSSPYCSPSRAAIMTGRHPARLKITDFIPSTGKSGKFLPADMKMELPLEEVTIAEVKRLPGMLADRPAAVAALARIFLDEITRLLLTASGVNPAADTPRVSRPPFALERLSVRRGADGWIARIRSVLPRRDSRESKAPLARHVTDCLGETNGEGGRGVSARMPQLRR
jgi:hypothetical protein